MTTFGFTSWPKGRSPHSLRQLRIVAVFPIGRTDQRLLRPGRRHSPGHRRLTVAPPSPCYRLNGQVLHFLANLRHFLLEFCSLLVYRQDPDIVASAREPAHNGKSFLESFHKLEIPCLKPNNRPQSPECYGVRYNWRKNFLSVFPLAFFGISARNSIKRGALNPILSLQC